MNEINDFSQQLAKSGVKIALSTIPGIGPVISEAFSTVFDIEVNKRQIQFVADLAKRMEELEKHQMLELDKLPYNEKFVDVLLETMSLIRKTSNKKKIRAYQNATLNTACRAQPDEFYTHIFLQLLERFTHLHLAVIKVAGYTYRWFMDNDIPWIDKDVSIDMWRIELMICAAIPEISNPFVLDLIWTDLQQSGLIDNTPVDRVFEREEDLYESRLTLIGGQFLRFIDDPERLN